MQDRIDLVNDHVSKKSADRGEFADFSFVAADYLHHTAVDATEEAISSWSAITDEEEDYAWPFSCGNLPFSAVNQIVRYLSITDISRASQVCKEWNKFLWTNIHEIDLSTVQPDLFDQYWQSHISKVLKRPSRLLKMRMNERTTDASVANIPSIVPLEVINFTHCSLITANAIKNMCKDDPNALRPKKMKFPMLAELDLAYCEGIDDSALEQLGRHLSSLKRLNLAFSSNITDAGLAHLTRLRYLWRLDLQGLKNLTDQGIKQLVDLPNLRVLELTGCVNLTSAGVEALRTKATQLEVLIWGEVSDKPVVGPTEKAPKRGLFSKPGHIKNSIFRVSRGTQERERSKSFLPSFKKRKTTAKLNVPAKKTQSAETVAVVPPDEEIEEDQISPRSSRNRAKKAGKDKIKDKKIPKARRETDAGTAPPVEKKEKEKEKEKDKEKDKQKRTEHAKSREISPEVDLAANMLMSPDVKRAKHPKKGKKDKTRPADEEEQLPKIPRETSPVDVSCPKRSTPTRVPLEEGDEGVACSPPEDSPLEEEAANHPRQSRNRHGKKDSMSSNDSPAGKKRTKKGTSEDRESLNAEGPEIPSESEAIAAPELAVETTKTDLPRSKTDEKLQSESELSVNTSTPELPPSKTNELPEAKEEIPTEAVEVQIKQSTTEEVLPSANTSSDPEGQSVFAKRAAFERAVPQPNPVKAKPSTPKVTPAKPKAIPSSDSPKEVKTPVKTTTKEKPIPTKEQTEPTKSSPSLSAKVSLSDPLVAQLAEADDETNKRASLVVQRRAVFESYQGEKTSSPKSSSPLKVDATKPSTAALLAQATSLSGNQINATVPQKTSGPSSLVITKPDTPSNPSRSPRVSERIKDAEKASETTTPVPSPRKPKEIGRASCRERVLMPV